MGLAIEWLNSKKNYVCIYTKSPPPWIKSKVSPILPHDRLLYSIHFEVGKIDLEKVT